MKIIKKFLPLIVVILLSFWAVKPFFSSGFFPMHDDTQVGRVFEMGKALRDGMFPVRWVQDLGYGYGYPIFNFYAPLAYYVGGFFNVLGFDALISTKIMMGIGILLSGIFMFVFASELFGGIGGVVAALFYVYAPYHAIDIYVRGDVAEFWAYAFIPLAFYGLIKVYKEGKWRFVILGSLGIAGIILSHNLTAMMSMPFLLTVALLYCFVAYRNKRLSIIFYLLFTISLGLLLSAFYWLPALMEMKYTNVFSQIGGGADFRDHFVCLSQLWQSPWGFGGSSPGCVDGISFAIGKLHIIMSAIFIIFFFVFSKLKSFHSNNTYHYGIALFSVIGFLVSILLTLEISKPIWEAVLFMAFFQYPWRFLLLTSFFSSFLAGAVFLYFKNFPLKLLASCFLLISLFFYSVKYFQPQEYLSISANNYISETNIKWTTSKISDEYMPENFNKPKSESEIATNKLVAIEKDVKILYGVQNTRSIRAFIDSPKDTKLRIAFAFFPSWNILLDNRKVSPEDTNQGMSIFLPKGRHEFDMEFIETPIEKLADAISLTSLFVLIAGIILSRKSLLYG